MFLGLLTLFVALCISAIAAYYSILGLTAIFAAAFLPIILMGSVLEVGKILTTVWLHQNWKRAPRVIKFYLTTAVVVLMFITSMGVFGFLSKAHIEQTALSVESNSQIERIESEIVRYRGNIERAELKIKSAESSQGNSNEAIQQQIDKEQDRIDNAYSRIEPLVQAQNRIIQDATANDNSKIKPYLDQIAQLDAQIGELTKQANEYEGKLLTIGKDRSALESKLKPYQDQIDQINAEIAKLDKLVSRGDTKAVKQYQQQLGIKSDGVFGSNTAKATQEWRDGNDKKLRTISGQMTRITSEWESQQNTERDRIRGIIDKIRNEDIATAESRKKELLAQIEKVNQTESPTIVNARAEIKRLNDSASKSVENSQRLIEQLRSKITVGADADADAIIDEQQQRIKTANTEIDKLIEEKYKLEATNRKLEAEVGPVKYIAELVYENADRNALETAVRWVIIIIVAVFDPLAVCLVLAGVMSITWWRQERGIRNTPKQKIVRVDDPRIEVLEMELQKHNQILDELEKLLDSNLGKVDPEEYAQLKAEQERLIAEQAAMVAALAEAKAESDALVDKVIATEEERDNYKKQLDEISQGASAFQTRIEELLAKIAAQEAEIQRRDAVVMKMAEKYQLVEKDDFANDIVADANGDGVPDIFQQEEPKKD
jgi:DNA repair exonuclease SbcCD ATPase subunit